MKPGNIEFIGRWANLWPDRRIAKNDMIYTIPIGFLDIDTPIMLLENMSSDENILWAVLTPNGSIGCVEGFAIRTLPKKCW